MPTAVGVPELPAIPPFGFVTWELFAKTPATILVGALMELPLAERLVMSLMYSHDLSVEVVAPVMKLDAHNILAIPTLAVDRLSELVRIGVKHTN